MGGKQKSPTVWSHPKAGENGFVETCKKYSAADWRANLGKLKLIDFAKTYAIEVPETEWARVNRALQLVKRGEAASAQGEMTANFPARQHFIAQMMQKRFVDGADQLHFRRREWPTNRCETTTPAKLFVERHIYTQTGLDSTQNADVEYFFSSLESVADPILEHIVCSAQEGNEPALDRQVRDILELFIYLQFKRVPDFHALVPLMKDPEAFIAAAIKHCESRHGPLSEENLKYLRDPQVIKKIQQNAKAASILLANHESLSILARKDLFIVRLPKPTKAFVLGSLPIAKLGREVGREFAPAGLKIWLPIASDVALCLAEGHGRTSLINTLSDAAIRAVNLKIAGQSTMIAARSRELILSLARLQ